MDKKELTEQEKLDIQRIAKLMAAMTIEQITQARNRNIAFGVLIGVLISTIVQLIANG